MFGGIILGFVIVLIIFFAMAKTIKDTQKGHDVNNVLNLPNISENKFPKN
ncbi:hypothetical protein [Priestia aryabhattai]